MMRLTIIDKVTVVALEYLFTALTRFGLDSGTSLGRQIGIRLLI